jgi:hypothetical protein
VDEFGVNEQLIVIVTIDKVSGGYCTLPLSLSLSTFTGYIPVRAKSSIADPFLHFLCRNLYFCLCKNIKWPNESAYVELSCMRVG